MKIQSALGKQPRVEEKAQNVYQDMWDGLKGRKKIWPIQIGPDSGFSNKL